MTEFYFDCETTGRDPAKDRIITIQFMDLNKDGLPTILKSWETQEAIMLSFVADKFFSASTRWNILVGNNLNFDLRMLSNRMNFFGIKPENLSPFGWDKPRLDLQAVLVLINKGSFKGASRLIGKDGDNANVPIWYERKEYDRIEDYIKNEAIIFKDFYWKVKKHLELFSM